MLMHQHQSCGRGEEIWFPVEGIGLIPHPWCIKCGVVKNISDDKAKRLGYWINVLSDIVNNFKLTKVQQRLIIKAVSYTHLTLPTKA